MTRVSRRRTDRSPRLVAINAVAFTDVQRLPLRGPKQPLGLDFAREKGHMPSASSGSPCLAQRLPVNQHSRAKGMLRGCRPLVISHP
jgi:hypothetical protein